MRRHARQQLLLDFQVFRHRLNYPVAPGKLGQIVFEVAGANARGGGRRVKGSGLALLKGVERFVGDSVPRAIGRGQIQKQHAHAGIRQMRGNARPHGACAQHCSLAQQQRCPGLRGGGFSLSNSFHALLVDRLAIPLTV